MIKAQFVIVSTIKILLTKEWMVHKQVKQGMSPDSILRSKVQKEVKVRDPCSILAMQDHQRPWREVILENLRHLEAE